MTDKPVSERASVSALRKEILAGLDSLREVCSKELEAVRECAAELTDRAGHRVYRQSDGEACFLCLVLARAEKAEGEVERLKEALEFAAGAIADAIGLEDGLDAAVGEAVLKKIEAVHPEPIARFACRPPRTGP